MNGFEAYRTYLAVKQHFNSKAFDFHKYNGKVNVKLSSFQTRNDKIFFEKLAKNTDIIDYLVANFSANEKVFIRELFSEECKRIYTEWQKRQQSLSYIFKEDLGKLESHFDSNFFCVSNDHPILLKKYIGKEITLETICILLDITKATKLWDKHLHDDPVYDVYSLKFKKYMPFIRYNKSHFKKTIVDFYS